MADGTDDDWCVDAFSNANFHTAACLCNGHIRRYCMRLNSTRKKNCQSGIHRVHLRLSLACLQNGPFSRPSRAQAIYRTATDNRFGWKYKWKWYRNGGGSFLKRQPAGNIAASRLSARQCVYSISICLSIYFPNLLDAAEFTFLVPKSIKLIFALIFSPILMRHRHRCDRVCSISTVHGALWPDRSLLTKKSFNWMPNRGNNLVYFDSFWSNSLSLP